MVLANFVHFQCYSPPVCCCDNRGDAGDDRVVESQAYASVGDCSIGEDVECFHDSFVFGLYTTSAVSVTASAAASSLCTEDRWARRCAVDDERCRGVDRPGDEGCCVDQADLGCEDLDEGRKSVDVPRAEPPENSAWARRLEVSVPTLSRTPPEDELCTGAQAEESHPTDDTGSGSPSVSVAAESVQRPWVPGASPTGAMRPGSGLATTPGPSRRAPEDVLVDDGAPAADAAQSAAAGRPPLSAVRRPCSGFEEELLDVSDIYDSPTGYFDRFTGFHEVGSLDDDDYRV